MKKDVFLIKDTERNVFACACSLSTDYTELYEWLRNRSYVCVSENFPWDVFLFSDEKDQEEFETIYEESIVYE